MIIKNLLFHNSNKNVKIYLLNKYTIIIFFKINHYSIQIAGQNDLNSNKNYPCQVKQIKIEY